MHKIERTKQHKQIKGVEIVTEVYGFMMGRAINPKQAQRGLQRPLPFDRQRGFAKTLCLIFGQTFQLTNHKLILKINKWNRIN